MLCANILEPSTSLKACPFVDHMQERAAADVYDVDNDTIVKLNIVLQSKAKATQGLTVFLTRVTILGKVLKGLLVNIVVSSLVEYSLQSLYKWVAKSVM